MTDSLWSGTKSELLTLPWSSMLKEFEYEIKSFVQMPDHLILDSTWFKLILYWQIDPCKEEDEENDPASHNSCSGTKSVEKCII